MLKFKQVIEKFGKYVVQQSRNNLTRGQKNVSKELYNSVGYDSKASKNSFQLEFYMEQYGMFLDKGVRGANPSLVKNGKQKAPLSPFRYKNKMPPMESILNWVRFRRIRLRDDKGRFKAGSYRSIAFIIQKRIYAQGLKPTMWFTRPFLRAFESLPDDLVEAYAIDVETLLGYTLREIDTNPEEGPSQFKSTNQIPDNLDADMLKFFGVKF